MKSYIPVLFIAAAITAFTVGCKKEYEQTPYNYTNILSFAYTDGEGQLQKAAVKGDSIIVYWPEYMNPPATVTTQIVVAEKATVSPASGQPLELVTGAPVTVTAQDGTAKTYYLKILQNLPPILITGGGGLSTVRGDTSGSWINGNNAVRNIYPDAPDTKFYAVKEDGSEYEIGFRILPSDGTGRNFLHTYVGFDIDVNSYKLKIVNAGRTVVSDAKILQVVYKSLAFNRLTEDLTIQNNKEISFSGSFNRDFTLNPYSPKTLYLVKRTYDVVSPIPQYGQLLGRDTLGTLTYVSNTNEAVTYKAQLKQFGTFKYFDDINYIIQNPALYDSPTELTGVVMEQLIDRSTSHIPVHFDIPYRYVKINLTQ
ncbi:MAG: hypothetical protein QM594_06645 [Niabella sp.]